MLRLGLPVAVLLVVATVVGSELIGSDSADDAGQATVPAAEAVEAATLPSVGDTSAPADEDATVEEVWLLDRGTGVYDWGAIVASSTDAIRRDLAVTVVLADADGAELSVQSVRIAELAPGSRAIIGGTAEDLEGTPTRIQVTSTLGTADPDGDAIVMDVVDVRRISSGQISRDDRLLGTVHVDAGRSAAMTTVSIAALWRDESGDVVASVVGSVTLGPGLGGEPDAVAGREADFSLRLPRSIVPARTPDEVVGSAALLE